MNKCKNGSVKGSSGSEQGNNLFLDQTTFLASLLSVFLLILFMYFLLLANYHISLFLFFLCDMYSFFPLTIRTFGAFTVLHLPKGSFYRS